MMTKKDYINKAMEAYEKLREGGRRGGEARKKKLSKKRRSEIARNAVRARIKKNKSR